MPYIQYTSEASLGVTCFKASESNDSINTAFNTPEASSGCESWMVRYG
jgi:hypothetical protein